VIVISLFSCITANTLDVSLSQPIRAFTTFLNGSSANSKFGTSVKGIGDFNGDGFGDFAVSAPYASSKWYNGNVYIFFGFQEANITTSLSSAGFPSQNGFVIYGESDNDLMGTSVSNAGDLNGDGLSDIIISSELSSPSSNARHGGTSYVIYGRKNVSNIDLATLNTTVGFRIKGSTEYEYSGCSVSSAGDVNGDGVNDLIVGAYNATNKGYANTGAAYVIYGKRSGLTDINLGSLTKAQGFAMYGSVAGEGFGYSVSGADVNNDGYSDLIIGSYYYNGFTGRAFVVFGQSGTRDSLQMKQMKLGREGFLINAAVTGDGIGISVAGVADINGDKIPDIVLGAYWSSYVRLHAGAVYVIYGRKSFIGTMNLDSITSTDGFIIGGPQKYSAAGNSVASGGDFNGDGINDIVIGLSKATINGAGDAGMAFVIFGLSEPRSFLDLYQLPAIRGFSVDGVQASDLAGYSVGGGCDFNHDNFSDIIVGATGASVGRTRSAGRAYIVYGSAMPTSEPSQSETTYILGLNFGNTVVFLLFMFIIACCIFACVASYISAYCWTSYDGKETAEPNAPPSVIEQDGHHFDNWYQEIQIEFDKDMDQSFHTLPAFRNSQKDLEVGEQVEVGESR